MVHRGKGGQEGAGTGQKGARPEVQPSSPPHLVLEGGSPVEGHWDAESGGQRWGPGKGRSGETGGERGRGTETLRGTWGRSRSPHPQVFPFGVGPPCLQQQQARSSVSSQRWVAGRLLGTPLSGYLVSGAALTWWGPPDGQCTKSKEKVPRALSILCSDDLEEDITRGSVCFGCSGSSLWQTGSLWQRAAFL